jgi:RNA polymerase sigma-70 factor (ECF subfamily)
VLASLSKTVKWPALSYRGKLTLGNCRHHHDDLFSMTSTPVTLLQRLRGPVQQQTTAAAWAEFVELYTPLLYAWATRLGLQPSDAADMVQDVFVILVQKLPEFAYDAHKSFRAWLRTILMNRWRDRQKHAAVVGQQSGAAVLDEVSSPDQTLELEEAEYREVLVRRALELMRREFRPATWKACWEQVVIGRSAAAVAAELGISVNAAYVARSRVLRRLREYLDQLLD